MSEHTEHVPDQRRDTRFALAPPLALGILRKAHPGIPAQLVNVSRSGATILSDVLPGDRGGLLVLDLPDRSARERAVGAAPDARRRRPEPPVVRRGTFGAEDPMVSTAGGRPVVS